MIPAVLAQVLLLPPCVIMIKSGMALRMREDEDQGGMPQKKVIGKMDGDLEKRVREFLDRWDQKTGDGKGDMYDQTSVLEVMQREIINLQYRLGEVEHAATYSWEVRLPSPISDSAKEWVKHWQTAGDDRRRLGKPRCLPPQEYLCGLSKLPAHYH